MKKKIYLLGLLISLFFLMSNAQTLYYYYYNGVKQYFELDTKHIFVSVDNENVAGIFASYNHLPFSADISEGKRSKTDFNRLWSVISFEENYSQEAYLTKLAEIKNKESNLIVAPYLKNQYQDKIGLSNFLYVKLKSLNDTTLLKREAEKEQAVVVYQNDFMPLWFIVSVTARSKYNAMELANHFYESGLFQYAEPDLMVDDMLHCANDTYFGDQWGLKNIGQYGGTSGIDIKACDAWQISTGAGIVVAVLDQGINLNHPDLAANIHTSSFDSESGTLALPVPQIVKGDHGTACAGIIGAIRNTNGITGIAPDCKLMSVSNSLEGTTLSREKRANGISWAWRNGADIISNSWGSSTYHQVIDDAITDAVTQGRNYKGCIILFASGNGGGATVSYPANLSNVIAVGAVSPCGERKSNSSCDGEGWGSQYGNELSVVAPGVLIPTTDNNNVNGFSGSIPFIWKGYNPSQPIHLWDGGNKIANDYTDQNYTVWFNGTSAACPHVAGVAALVLSVNPNLKGRHVRYIIESTAQQVGGYNYQIDSNRPGWNDEMGYGLVNAYAAVQKAVECPTTTVNFIGAVTTPIIVTADTTKESCGDINVQYVTVTNGATLTLQAMGDINVQDLIVTNGATLILEAGSDIDMKEAVVINNSKLIMNSGGEVTIERDFEVELGSELEIN